MPVRGLSKQWMGYLTEYWTRNTSAAWSKTCLHKFCEMSRHGIEIYTSQLAPIALHAISKLHFPRVAKTATLLKVASQSSKSSLIMASSVLGKRARAPESLTGTYQNVLNATPSTNSPSQSHLPSLRASNGETNC